MMVALKIKLELLSWDDRYKRNAETYWSFHAKSDKDDCNNFANNENVFSIIEVNSCSWIVDISNCYYDKRDFPSQYGSHNLIWM